MADIPEIRPCILAPFVKEVNAETGECVAELSETVMKHLRNPEFTTEVDPDKRPGYTKFNLIPTHSVGVDEHMSVDKLVEREFGGSQWSSQVTKLLQKKGLIEGPLKDHSDEPVYNHYGRDDNYYTVKLENLPENEGREEISQLLVENGCNYFERVNVPFDDRTGQYKLNCFVKFRHLRHAIKFCEDFRNIRSGTMLLSASLTV